MPHTRRSLIWQTALNLSPDTSGQYLVRCVFESEPIPHEPIVITSEDELEISNGLVDLSALDKIVQTMADRQHLPHRDAVGWRLYEKILQLIIVGELDALQGDARH